MPRNSSRLDTEKEIEEDSSPVVEIAEQKTDLGYPQPTEMVDLPTKGRFYHKGHPLCGIDCIEIRHMTTKDEEILNSKTLLQKGVALDKMISGLLIDKKIKVEDLFIGDRNALVVAARVTAYGAEYKTSVTCPACDTKAVYAFNLLDLKAKEGVDDVPISDDGTFELTLPKTNSKVEIRILNGKDEKSLRMLSENKTKHNLPESPFRDLLKTIIISIDGNTSKQFITERVDNMLAIQSSFIREEYARITPDLNIKQDFECNACGTFSVIRVPLTSTNFFWPNR